MERIFDRIDALIGGTPLLHLSAIEKETGLSCRLLAKLESMNPTGSAKDRAALAMIDDAEKRGRLSEGGVIIEPTSGNTGIALAAVAAARGYRALIVMPENMSRERQMLIKAYGGEVILTPAEKGMTGAIEKAQELCASLPGSLIAGQFENPANPRAHYETTGPEIWEDTEGAIDYFVAGIGTGGTLTGTGRYLKEKNPFIRVIGAEPLSSPLLTQGVFGPHGLQGMGANFIPETLDRSVADEILPVSEGDAFSMARLLGKKAGVLCGISSGAALWAAVEIGKRPESKGKTIVVLLPDTGERYLSTPLFSEE